MIRRKINMNDEFFKSASEMLDAMSDEELFLALEAVGFDVERKIKPENPTEE